MMQATAVDSLTITANAGEVFDLLGSNGAQWRNTP
jgi:ABC-type Na+ transport system ATPase subunit NatA